MGAERTFAEEQAILDNFLSRLGDDGDIGQMSLGQFSGEGVGNDRINLSTLHSAKGREFDVTVLFGMDTGRIPRANASQTDLIAARRLFYVGVTRARTELHMVFSAHNPSAFVTEVQNRIG
jgi:DNA helicase-2/ATP-dependent DNA helicase PcrA